MNAPPLLVSFTDLEQYLAALPVALPEDQVADISRLVSMGLPPVTSVRALSVLFGYTPFFVGALRKKPERYYRVFKISKGRGFREIHAPRVALKVIQKWFAEHLSKTVIFDECIFGFIPGKSSLGAAAIHCNATWVYSADIESFFPSIRWAQVRAALINLGYSIHASELLADLCCYQKHLAQGSPASPVLSNLVFKEIDVKFKEFASKHNIRYTRYADDIVFSGMDEFPKDLQQLVRSSIESQGWRLAAGKESLSRLPYRLKVHGLLVHGSTPRLTKSYRNLLRAYRHLIAVGRVSDLDQPKLKGHLAYAHAVDVVSTPPQNLSE